MVKTLRQSDIADALGLSPAAVSTFKARGMPMDSVEAAREWHRRSVRPRVSTNPRRAYAAQFAALERLWPVARAALDANTLDAVLPSLQAALRAIPEHVRHLAQLDSQVMTAICGPWAAFFKSEVAEAELVVPLGEEDAELMGRVWYSLAANEPFPFRWLEGDAG